MDPSVLGSGLIPNPVILPSCPTWKPAVCGCLPLLRVLSAKSRKKNRVARCPRVNPSTLSCVSFCPSKVAKTCSLRVPAFCRMYWSSTGSTTNANSARPVKKTISGFKFLRNTSKGLLFMGAGFRKRPIPAVFDTIRGDFTETSLSSERVRHERRKLDGS